MSANPPSHPAPTKIKWNRKHPALHPPALAQPASSQAVPKSRSTRTTHWHVGTGRQASQRVSTRASHSDDSTLITWDKDGVPHTEQLLSWLQSHPADRVVLFHDDDVDERSSGRLKNDIHAVIANFIFSTCSIYSTAYASHPEQFSSSVANRLTTLKSKYHSCTTALKSTGAGVNPGDGYTNLIDKVKADFPWFDKCDALWAGNPSNDASQFSSVPNGNTNTRTTDFPLLPKRAAVTLREPGDLDNEDEMEFRDGCEPSNATAGFHVEDEETDVEEDNYGLDEGLYGGASTGSSGVYSGVYDGGGYDEEMQERRSFQPFTLGQQPSHVLSNTRTPSSEGRTTLRMAAHPYHPRAPTATTSSISHTSSTKDKNMLSRIRSEIAGKLDELEEGVKDKRLMSMMLKAERYNMKLDYHSRGRELDFLKAERERERVDAELTHRRQQESKQAEIEHEKMKLQLAELETQQLMLKIKLAELQQGKQGGSLDAV